MTTTATQPPLTGLAQRLADHGLRLDRAMPRSADHLLLQLTRHEDGTPLPGQWYADPERAATVARQTGRAAAGAGHAARVRLLGDHVVTQADGADRRLTALAGLLDRPGAALVAHRPERRAVVRHHHDGVAVFTKVVRPGRAGAVARTLPGAGAGTRDRLLAHVVAVDEDRGTVTTSALPGRTLHELWDRPGQAPPPAAALAAAGRAVAALHARPIPGWAGHHGHDDELAVTTRWLDLAQAHGVLPLPRAALDGLLRRADGLLGARGHTTRPVPVHRDLHDKQVLVDGTSDHGGGARLLDLDLMAAGDPVLDVANLLVHVELRVRQGLLTPDRARSCRDAFLAGYGTGDLVARALSGYALATRLRLLAVYAFRPRSTEAAIELVTHPLFEEMT